MPLISADKAMEDLVEDEDFWSWARDLMLRRMRPIWLASFMTGVELAREERATKADEEDDDLLFRQAHAAAITQAAEAFIATYQSVWWAQISEATRGILRSLIATARLEGHKPAWVADQIADQFGEARAMRIAVTEMTNLIGGGAQAEYRVAGWTEWEWSTAMDRRVCPVCADLEGRRFDINLPFSAAHPSCVAAGTVITGAAVEAAMSRPFDGDVILIRTAGGNQLTITPNHPILTRGGWVPAGDIRQGHDLLCYDLPEGMPALVGPDDQQMPTVVEEIAGALLRSPAMLLTRVPASAEQFHGDGTGGYVDVVGAFRHLVPDDSPPRLQPPADGGLLLRGVPAGFYSPRTTRERLVTRSAPLAGSVGGLNLYGALLCRHGRPFKGFRGSLSTGSYPGLHQSAPDNKSVTPEALRDRILGLPGDVSVDHRSVIDSQAVVGMREDRVTVALRRPFRGHVYNLQARAGWYAANGIIISNCRCWPVPAGQVL